ncbi:MAG: hypothetical protein K6G19_03735 [Lachnospiraceae bacterium]|nr:hypothetical protein [Lachnospiraceae bacterium]
MIKKFLKKITNNLGLKLLAVVVAVALWLLVVNYDDPVIMNSYSGIQVEILHPEALTDQNKVYEVLDETDVVDVTIEGKRSVIDSLNKENIRATADMTQMTDVNTLTIDFSTNKNDNQLESIVGDHSVVRLAIENRKEKHLPIEVEVTGNPMEGYIVGDVTTNQNTVRISGPESVVDTIASAKCNVSVSGRSSDISSTADIVLFDKNGNEVEHENLTTNISSINVNISILEQKAVDIIYSMSGVPAEGYAVDGDLQADRTAVVLAGRSSVMETMNNLVIPSEVLSVNGKSEEFTVQIDLNDYLPSGVQLVSQDGSDFNGIVNVYISIVPLVDKTFDVPVENITLLDVPEGYDAKILTDVDDEDDDDGKGYVSLTTVAVEHYYDGVYPFGINGEVDIDGYFQSANTDPAEGIYRIKVDFALPEGISARTVTYVDVRLTEKEN